MNSRSGSQSSSRFVARTSSAPSGAPWAFDVFWRFGSNGAIRRAARAGLGVSFVSRDAVALELEARQLGVIAVEPGPTPRRWQVMRSSVGPLRPIVEQFIEFVLAPATVEGLRAEQLEQPAVSP